MDPELEAANRGWSGWLMIAVAAVTILGTIGYMLS